MTATLASHILDAIRDHMMLHVESSHMRERFRVSETA